MDGPTLIESGRWTLFSGRKGQHRAERWLNLETQLSTLVAKHTPDVIAYERVRRHVGTTAAHVYGGLLAQLELLDLEWTADNASIALVPVEISTWRKAAIGRGDACKDEVERWARKKYRFNPKSQDEAEAVAIAEAVRRIRTGEYVP